MVATVWALIGSPNGHPRGLPPATPTLFLFLAVIACEPTIPPPEPAGIKVSPARAELHEVGETVQLRASVRDEDGKVIEAYEVGWSTSDSSVATVSSSGLVRAEEEDGTATITGTAGSVSATATITVLTNRDWRALRALYNTTDGPNWARNAGWLTDAPLAEWDGVKVNDNGRVIALELVRNDLAGVLPGELGLLDELQRLRLGLNDIRGSIPPQIGNLGKLTLLTLSRNDLTGSIPSELGKLARLTSLGLNVNELSGPIPPELGQLSRLEEAYLSDNRLSGEIPPELGQWSDIRTLMLSDNRLSGEIPPELGQLTKVRVFLLERLGLTGTIPDELGGLDSVRLFSLVGNALTGPLPESIGELSDLTNLVVSETDLSGPLPGSLTALTELKQLIAWGTGLCAPTDEGFQRWLKGVRKQRVRSCGTDPNGGSVAYLTQATQSMEFPVPLVAGEEALLRVFVVAPKADGEIIPLVRAIFHPVQGDSVVVDIEPGSSVIGDEVDESSLEFSANAEISASLVQPGLEMVVEIDPYETMDPDLGVSQRIPPSGRAAVDVREMPTLQLTLIPFLHDQNPDSSILDITEDLQVEDPLLWHINTLMPVGEFELAVHEPVTISSNNPYEALRRTSEIRIAENGVGYYMGTMPTFAGWAGLGYLAGWVSVAIPDSSVMSHELGHNLDLEHAPCGTGYGWPFVDLGYPDPEGSIAAWGYDFTTGELVDAGVPDMMSYCIPNWIGDYHFSSAARYRLEVEGPRAAAARASPSQSLLIRGGVDEDGAPFLEPAFVLDARPSLPRATGAYRLTGTAADGEELFALNFAMPVVVDGDGRSAFAFALPAQSHWADGLARISLVGPAGSYDLDRDTDRPAAIMRDPRTGRIRAVFSELPSGVVSGDEIATLAPVPGLDILFSRGIPDGAAWRR